MKKFLALLAFAAFAATGAVAQQDKASPEKKLTAQQQRMKDCNAQAGEKSLKGDERKKFMSACLRGDSAAKAGSPPRTAQQEKMASCNKQAGEKKLKGAERKTFMSDCLKG